MKIILTIFMFSLFINHCGADEYKKIREQVKLYENIANSLNNIKIEGDELYHKGLLSGSEYIHAKKYYNLKYGKFIEIAYMLEEIIIMEGGLTIDDMLVSPLDRGGNIDDIGKRRYHKTVTELSEDIDRDLKILFNYEKEVRSFYEYKQKQRQRQRQ